MFHNKDFNWSIPIPKGFEKVADSSWAKMQEKGAAAIENTYDTKVDNQAKTIFVFKSDQHVCGSGERDGFTRSMAKLFI